MQSRPLRNHRFSDSRNKYNVHADKKKFNERVAFHMQVNCCSSSLNVFLIDWNYMAIRTIGERQEEEKKISTTAWPVYLNNQHVKVLIK